MLLNALFEPIISQHPGFIRRLSYFGDAFFRNVMLE